MTYCNDFFNLVKGFLDTFILRTLLESRLESTQTHLSPSKPFHEYQVGGADTTESLFEFQNFKNYISVKLTFSISVF